MTDRPPPKNEDPELDDLPVASHAELLWERARGTVYLLLLFLLFVLVFWYQNIFIYIDSGHAGVRWKRFWGGTELVTYPEGFHVIWPWDTMHIYDVRVQELGVTTMVYAKDGLEIHADVSVRYRPNYDRLSYLHRDVGPDYVEKLVKPEVISTLRKVLGNFEPNDIYAKDEQGMLNDLQATMEADFETEYVGLDKFLVKELLLPEHIQAAIQDKLEQEQMAKAYYFILEKEEYEHQRRIIEATGIRDFEEISGVPILRWRGLEVTEALATSPNTKVIIAGTGADQLPVILNADAGGASERPAPAAEEAPRAPYRPGASSARPAVVPEQAAPEQAAPSPAPGEPQ